MEEADGGARGEGHPDTAAGFHHECHTHRLVLVRLEALLHTEGMGYQTKVAIPASPHSPGSGVPIFFKSTS